MVLKVNSCDYWKREKRHCIKGDCQFFKVIEKFHNNYGNFDQRPKVVELHCEKLFALQAFNDMVSNA